MVSWMCGADLSEIEDAKMLRDKKENKAIISKEHIQNKSKTKS